MVYGIVDSEKPDKIVLVKTGSREGVETRLQLKESEHIVASFTDAEIGVLNTSSFAVVTG